MAALARLPESHPVIKDHKIFLRKRHNRWVGQTLTLYLNFSLVRGYLLQKPTFSNKRNRALLFSVGIKINTERPRPRRSGCNSCPDFCLLRDGLFAAIRN